MIEPSRRWPRRWSGGPLKAWLLGALLLGSCGGDVERRPAPPVLTGCERYCVLREQCSGPSQSCAGECAWLDQGSTDLHPDCAEKTLLGCALDDSSRVECAAEGVTLELSGCPEHQPGSSCAVGFNPARGAFQLAFAQAGQEACPWADAAVGQADASSGAEPDGLQQFLKEAGDARITIIDRAVQCAIAENDDGFELTVSLRHGSQSLALTGEVVTSGAGEVALTYHDDADSPALESGADSPCSIAVRPSPSSGGLALSTRFIWADIECSRLAPTLSADPMCSAVGTILFENCSQL